MATKNIGQLTVGWDYLSFDGPRVCVWDQSNNLIADFATEDQAEMFAVASARPVNIHANRKDE